jgi:hypothetical protein
MLNAVIDEAAGLIRYYTTRTTENRYGEYRFGVVGTSSTPSGERLGGLNGNSLGVAAALNFDNETTILMDNQGIFPAGLMIATQRFRVDAQELVITGDMIASVTIINQEETADGT